MKSKALLIGSILAVGFAGLAIWHFNSAPFPKALKIEWIESRFPESLDSKTVLPFGYTLGPWPTHFLGEPIVMKMAYHTGPPKQCIQTMTQLWKPVEVELRIEGPTALIKGMKVSDWKKCFASGFSCHAEKKKLAE